MFPRRPLDQNGQTEPLGAFAAFCGKEVKLLVEADSAAHPIMPLSQSKPKTFVLLSS